MARQDRHQTPHQNASVIDNPFFCSVIDSAHRLLFEFGVGGSADSPSGGGFNPPGLRWISDRLIDPRILPASPGPRKGDVDLARPLSQDRCSARLLHGTGDAPGRVVRGFPNNKQSSSETGETYSVKNWTRIITAAMVLGCDGGFVLCTGPTSETVGLAASQGVWGYGYQIQDGPYRGLWRIDPDSKRAPEDLVPATDPYGFAEVVNRLSDGRWPGPLGLRPRAFGLGGPQ